MTTFVGADQWVNFFIGWVLLTGIIGYYVARDNSLIVGSGKIFVVANEGVLLAGAIYIADLTGISPLDILDNPYLFPSIFVTLLLYAAISAPLASILIIIFGMIDIVPNFATGESVMISGRDRLVLVGAFVGSVVCVIFTWIVLHRIMAHKSGDVHSVKHFLLTIFLL